MESDHRLLWTEVTDSSILGKALPPLPPLQASRLRASDPRSRKKYIKRVKLRYRCARVGPWCTKLHRLVQEFAAGDTALHDQIVTSYTLLHRATTHIRHDVERHLRTFHTGAVPYSPRLQP